MGRRVGQFKESATDVKPQRRRTAVGAEISPTASRRLWIALVGLHEEYYTETLPRNETKIVRLWGKL